jgi:hypothetical protein
MSTKYRHVPWQRNIRRIPAHVASWLDENPDADFVIGCAKTIPLSALASYEHLGIGLAGGRLIYPESRIPIAEMGPYSTKNREGWEVKRDDLPMITRTFTFDVPNWGDPSNGYHTVEHDREVYQRDYFDAPMFAIQIELLKESDTAVVFKFLVDCAVDRGSADFEENLLFALNLLQENVGVCGVLPAEATHADILSSLQMNWEFFPPGTAPEVERFFSGRMKHVTPALAAVIKERASLFWRLEPIRYLRGTGGLNKYVGAQFADDLVVFENVNYGNAVWILFGAWAEISKRSRIDLLRLRDVPYERIVHTEGWQDRLTEFITTEKRKRGIKSSRRDGKGRAA